MNKDINPTKVENMAIAIVKEENDIGATVWNSYLINFNSYAIECVMVSSKGYSSSKKTSQLRHFLDKMDVLEFKLIEPIIEDVFQLTNEFWLSYSHNNELLDKKYIFVAGSIAEENLIKIPVINKSGVIIGEF